MRNLLLIAALAMSTLMSGCSDRNSGAEGDSDTATPPMVNTTAPEPLHFEASVPAGADPFNVNPAVATPPCSQSVSTCFYHDFTIEGNNSFSLEATLAWDLPANDFDLYLYQDGTQLSMDGINQLGTVEVPPTTQVMRHAPLAAGTYTFWVVAWNSVADGYTLDATFDTA